MFKLTKLVTLRPDIAAAERTRVEDTLRTAGKRHATRALLAPTLPGVYNGGDFIWHLQFADEGAYRAAMDSADWKRELVPLLSNKRLVANIESAAYGGGRHGERAASAPTAVYRTLFLALKPGADERTRARFETELFAMPDYIASMHRWQLSRVSAAAGARPWTHVWEQEYATLAGLQGPYMMHPYHWGHIDRWFDPECPDWIVDTHLCHTFSAVTAPVI